MQLKKDVTGGVTTAIIALPLALAFGMASGFGAMSGVWGTIILGFFASIFGGTKMQISGPTGPMAVVSARVFIFFKGDFNAIMSVFFLAGVFQICFGLFKVGRFIKFIPYPVVSGFMSGIGVLIIILQLNQMIGARASSTGVLGSLKSFISNVSNTNFISVFVFLLCLVGIYLTPKKIAKILPPSLLVLVLASFLVFIFSVDLELIGTIDASLPSVYMPHIDIERLPTIISFATILALLGSIESLLTSLVADSITKTKHDSDRELIGQGIGNAICGIFCTIPGAGATMRTVVNIKSGGTTRLSGVIHSLFLVLVLLVLSPVVSKIPLVVLSAILFKVGIDILDYRIFKAFRFAPKQDLIVMSSVFVLTVFVDLIFAVGAGVVLSSLFLMHRIASETKVDITEQHLEKADQSRLENDIRIMSISGAFFFGSTASVLDSKRGLTEEKAIIIDISKVPFVDLSAIFVLEEMINSSSNKIVALVLSKKQQEHKALTKVRQMVKGKIYLSQEEAIREVSKIL